MLVGSSEQAGACPILVLSSSSRFLVSLGSLLRALLWSSDALSQPAPACRASHWLHKRETVIGHPRSLTSHPTPSTDLPSGSLLCPDDNDETDDTGNGNTTWCLPQWCAFFLQSVGTDRHKYGSAHMQLVTAESSPAESRKSDRGPLKVETSVSVSGKRLWHLAFIIL